MRRRETLKTIVQTFCRRTGIPVPSTVFGSADAQVQQAVGLLEELCEDLVLQYDWQFLTRRTVFERKATLADPYHRLEFVTDPWFSRLVADSPVNITQQRRLYSIPTAERQASWEVVPQDAYSIEQDNLLVHSAVSGDMISVLWVTSAHVLSTDAVVTPLVTPTRTYFSVEKLLAEESDILASLASPQAFHNTTQLWFKGTFDGDEAVSLFPANLLLAGLRMKWAQEKGLESSMETLRFQHALLAAKLGDKTAASVDLGAGFDARETKFSLSGIVPAPSEDPLPAVRYKIYDFVLGEPNIPGEPPAYNLDEIAFGTAELPQTPTAVTMADSGFGDASALIDGNFTVDGSPWPWSAEASITCTVPTSATHLHLWCNDTTLLVCFITSLSIDVSLGSGAFSVVGTALDVTWERVGSSNLLKAVVALPAH